MNQTKQQQNIDTTSSATAAAAPAPAKHLHNPLAILERELLARPGRHHHQQHLHHHRSQTQPAAAAATTTPRSPGHLSPPTNTNAAEGSRTPSPAPSTGARRSMAATAAWMPLTEDAPKTSSATPATPPMPDRRHSWDWQAYRHAMMVQATGLACACHPSGHGHVVHAGAHRENSYEADRGFSEASHLPMSRG